MFRRWPARYAALFLSFVASWAAVASTPSGAPLAGWWLASGLIAWAMVQGHRRQAVVAIVVGAVATAAGNMIAGRPLGLSLYYGTFNALEAYVIATLITLRWRIAPRLYGWRDFRRYLVATLTGTMVIAAAVALSSMAYGLSALDNLTWVFVNHLAGNMVMMLLVVRRPRPALARLPEVVVHLAYMTLILWVIFSPDNPHPLAFLLLPGMVWAYTRFPRWWGNFEFVLLTGLITTMGVLNNGAFYSLDPHPDLLAVLSGAQAFIVACVGTALAFATSVEQERTRARQVGERERWIASLLDAPSDTAFVATDAEGTVRYFSRGAAKLLGRPAAEVVSRANALEWFDTDEVEGMARQLGVTPDFSVVRALSLRKGRGSGRDWTITTSMGEQVTVFMDVSAIGDGEDEESSGYLLEMRDVSRRRQAEAAVVSAFEKERQANDRILDADRAKNKFIASVSHELRTPLTAIIASAEMLEDCIRNDTLPVDAQLDMLGRLRRNGDRLHRLVEDVLTVTRSPEEVIAPKELVDVRDAVQHMAELVPALAQTSDVAFELQLSSEPVMVLADPQGLERIVLNLVSNAFKFTPAGGKVTVRVRSEDSMAVVEVIDTGVGIPDDEQNAVFTRFFRSQTVHETAILGNGLGLNIVKMIADLHGGQVTFTSVEGEGSTFIFRMPLAS